jgi:hypothetical protein
MNHEHINKFNVIDQYVLGQLTTREAEEFEDHFIECPTCVDQLNTTRTLVQNLKGLAVHETVLLREHSVPTTQGSKPKRLVPIPVSMAVAFGCIVVAGVLTFVGLRWLTWLESELRRTQEAASVARQEYQSSLANAAESEEQQKEARQQLAQRVDELERQLKQSGRKESEASGPGIAEVNFPIFVLASATREQAAPPTEIILPASNTRFAFSIPLEDTRDFSVYRVTVVDQRGRTVLNRTGFKPNQYSSLSLSLNSSLLASGTYNLSVEGLTPPNNWNTVGNYPFQLVRR